MKLNNEVMLIGVACLIVGGAAGYLLSEQNKTDYIMKGVEFGCNSAVNPDSQICEYAVVASEEFLQKKEQAGDVCPPCGCSPGEGAGTCCANCIIAMIENA